MLQIVVLWCLWILYCYGYPWTARVGMNFTTSSSRHDQVVRTSGMRRENAVTSISSEVWSANTARTPPQFQLWMKHDKLVLLCGTVICLFTRSACEIWKAMLYLLGLGTIWHISFLFLFEQQALHWILFLIRCSDFDKQRWRIAPGSTRFHPLQPVSPT